MDENRSSNGLERAIAEMRRVSRLEPYDPEILNYYDPETDEYIQSDPEGYGPYGVANWGWMYPDHIDLTFSEPCHGQLGDIPEKATGLIEFMTFEHGYDDLQWAAAAAFAEWMMTGPDFPWAVGRPSHYEPGLGWYWSRADLDEKPTNAIGAFLILSRKFFEHPYIINGWHELVGLGCKPRSAFFFAQYFWEQPWHTLNLGVGGHAPFDLRYRITREQYLNYMRGNAVGPSRSFIPQGDYFGAVYSDEFLYPPKPGYIDEIIAPLVTHGKWGEVIIDPTLTPERLAEFIKQQEVLCENEQL